MTILEELDRLIAQYPPPPAYPAVLTVITCQGHNGGQRSAETMTVTQIVATAKELWCKADVRPLPCGCVVVLPEDDP